MGSSPIFRASKIARIAELVYATIYVSSFGRWVWLVPARWTENPKDLVRFQDLPF